MGTVKLAPELDEVRAMTPERIAEIDAALLMLAQASSWDEMNFAEWERDILRAQYLKTVKDGRQMP